MKLTKIVTLVGDELTDEFKFKATNFTICDDEEVAASASRIEESEICKPGLKPLKLDPAPVLVGIESLKELRQPTREV